MNVRFCAFCGVKVIQKHKKDRHKTPFYSNTFINKSCGIDLVFCSKKHKDMHIHKVLKKNKSILFFLFNGDVLK